jgi:PAS domain-containing protein
VVDLSRTNNDMNNLLAGTGVGTLFVDSQARIVRFTPAATKVVNLIESDVGRPVGHVVTNLVGYDRLADDVRAVVDTLAPRETEVQTTDGVWFTMRIRPYRTLENIIEGAVITFSDVTDRKRAEERARRLALLVERNANPVVEMDYDGSIHFINEAARLLFPDLQSHPAGAHRWLPERAWVAQHFERGLDIWATREVTVDAATYQQDVFALPESRRLRIYGLDITDRPMTADQARGRP